MEYLYYENGYNERELIKEAEVILDEDVNKAIKEKTQREYIPYLRYWNNDKGETYFDYGSWSAFFVKSNIKL